MTPTFLEPRSERLAAPALLTPRAELARLDAHFINVLKTLHARPPRRLSPVQRHARADHLERLDRYRARGVFPKNRRFPWRLVPHFVDAEGTRCAMGHLIEERGGRDLVQHIAKARNYARIRELRGITELGAWLEANGLTVAEAARIQPAYCGSPANNCVCGHALVEGTLGDGGTTLTVTMLYGPVSGVAIGDVLTVTANYGVDITSGVVFANLEDFPNVTVYFGSVDGQVTIPTTMCGNPQFARIPGPLPLEVVQAALSANDTASCERVLTDYEARWGEIQGEGCASSGAVESDGCSVAIASPGTNETAVIIAVACLAYGARRARRRR